MKHDGVVFPKYIYQRIPFSYENKKIELGVYGELYVLLFLKHKDKHSDKTFVSNFLRSLSSYVGVSLSRLESCSFTHFARASVNRTKRQGNDTVTVGKKTYTYNPHIEPPSIFIGRGNHPRRGTIKPPLLESDVTLNHSNTNPWVAKYKDTLTKEQKYIMIQGVQDDREKFDTARKLYHALGLLRRRNSKNLTSSNTNVQQCATCVAIIDATCMRAGVEKGSDTAETVGCCSLRRKHVTFDDATRSIQFTFLGKDSIPWNVCVKHPLVYANIKRRMKGRTNDRLFSVQPAHVNAYIQSIVPGVSLKCFRTCHASGIMWNGLKDASTMDAFNRTNVDVARTLCHVRGDSVSCTTSKMNYIDPRIVVSWCKKHHVPIEKVYSAQLKEKYAWACSTPDTFIY